jgi:transposase
MRIIGCDLHAAQQTIAMLDRDPGEILERTLAHEGTRVRDFYAGLPPPIVVGIEATGSMGWFLRLMEELGVACYVGDPAKVRKVETRRQKHDRRDAALLLELLTEDRFPSIWMPSAELRDLRALLMHRDQWVRMRTRVKNALQGLALAHGVRRGAGLWTRGGQATLASLPLATHAGDRRSALQTLNDHLTKHIDELDQQVSEQALERPQARRLMTHPGVGPVTALATEVFLGEPSRFADAKALASYVGMIPSEYSSGVNDSADLPNRAIPCCVFSGAKRRFTPCDATPRWVASIDENCSRRGSAKRGSRWRGSPASDSGFCYAIRSTTRSSAVARRHQRRRGNACMRDACVEIWSVDRDRQNEWATRLPSTGVRTSHHGPVVTEEMFGGHHRH